MYVARYYSPSLARFNSIDVLAEDFVYLTPYQYASNTPVWAIDIDGLEAGHTTGETAVKEKTTRVPKSNTNDQNNSVNLWFKAAGKLGGFIELMLSPLECCKGQNSVDLGDIGLPDLEESEDSETSLPLILEIEKLMRIVYPFTNWMPSYFLM